MGENPKMVFNVGELGLDGFYYLKLLSREELSTKFNLDKNKKWVICTYHPETKISIDDNLKRIQSVLDVMNKFEDLQIIVTKSNADEGGNQINEIISNYSMKYSEKFIFIENLGQLNYLSLLKVAFFMIGNSSSAIFEAPVVPLFAINMGDRQKGRFFCKNILQCNGFASDIKDKINFIYTAPHNYLMNIKSPYGKGDSSKKMVTILKSIYKEKLNKKGFYDLI